MIIISYDISDDKLRTKFCKAIRKQGSIRVQRSVYEVENTKRIIDNIKVQIETFQKQFDNDDSIIVFEANKDTLIKYGNAIHRDKPIIFF